MLTTTTHERRAHVARMRHSFSLEGQQPDSFDEALQNAYGNGTVTLSDMLAYAFTYARMMASRELACLPAAA